MIFRISKLRLAALALFMLTACAAEDAHTARVAAGSNIAVKEPSASGPAESLAASVHQSDEDTKRRTLKGEIIEGSGTFFNKHAGKDRQADGEAADAIPNF